MANQRAKKRRLEEKLGLNHGAVNSGFDQGIVDILWDMMMNGYNDPREYPLIKQNRESWKNWYLFLVAREGHAAILAVDEQEMNYCGVTEQKVLSPYDVRDCLKRDAVVRRFHVVMQEYGHNYVQTDVLTFLEEELQYCSSLYVGTLEISLTGLKVLMAIVADQAELVVESDCLKYCEQFLPIYYGLIGENVSQSTIEEEMTNLKRCLASKKKRLSPDNLGTRTLNSHGYEKMIAFALLLSLSLLFVALRR